MNNAEIVSETLEHQVDHIIEEARMVLPGIQTLFGFQLIAVFNQRFDTALSNVQQELHLMTVIFIAISIALIMAPAAYHRQAERNFISKYLVNYASRLITVAMVPLLLAIAIDVGLVSNIITKSVAISFAVAIALLSFFTWFWFVVPRHGRHPKQHQ